MDGDGGGQENDNIPTDVPHPHRRRSFHFPAASGCVMMMMSSPAASTGVQIRNEKQYARLHHSNDGIATTDDSSGRVRAGPAKWRKFVKRLVKEGKNSIYGSSSATAASTVASKRLSFHYDAVSYSQNFDQGLSNW